MGLSERLVRIFEEDIALQRSRVAWLGSRADREVRKLADMEEVLANCHRQSARPRAGVEGSNDPSSRLNSNVRNGSRLCENTNGALGAMTMGARRSRCLVLDGGDEPLGAEDRDDPLEVVGQDVKADFGLHVRQTLHLEVCCPHPGLDCAERVFDGLRLGRSGSTPPPDCNVRSPTKPGRFYTASVDCSPTAFMPTDPVLEGVTVLNLPGGWLPVPMPK